MCEKNTVVLYSKRNLDLNFFMFSFAKKVGLNLMIVDNYSNLLNTIIMSDIDYLVVDATSTKSSADMINVFRSEGPLFVDYVLLVNAADIESQLSDGITQLPIKDFYNEVEARFLQTKSMTSNKIREDISDNIVHSIMHKFYFETKYLGYQYIKDSLNMIMHNNYRFKSLNKFIYPVIASKYNTTVACVERNIRGAINRAYIKAVNSGKSFNNDLYSTSNKNILSYLINIVKSATDKAC